MKKTIAFDIGGTCSRIALFENGKITWRDDLRTQSQEGPQTVVDAAKQLFQPLRGIDAPVGVAVTGQIVDGCVTAHNPGIMPGWHGFPFQDAVAAALERPIALANDARAAAWGEYCFGAGKGMDEFLFVTVSTGVGAGLVLNGRLHLARNGFDAEMGEMRVPEGGTLEDHASGTALSRAAAAHGYENGKALADAADAGDERAEALYRQGIRLVAAKLADLAVMLGIQRAAIGGGLGLRAGYLQRLKEEMAAYPSIYQMDLVAAELGADAGLYGAAALADSGLGTS
ncbi:MAG: hypothetical protein K0S28_1048 [Paucimonas sp.]|nr:hypothetical protein [Paucimonas sp.]